MIRTSTGWVLLACFVSIVGCSNSQKPPAGTAATAAAQAQQNTKANVDAVQNNPRLSDAQKAAIIAHLNNPQANLKH